MWWDPGGAGAFPVTVERKHGAIEMTAVPQRVVSLGVTDQGCVLALGVAPVWIREWLDEEPFVTWPWATDEMGDAEPAVLQRDELNFEKIAALRPDVIIGTYSGITAEDYEKLSQIAPTLAQSGDYIDFGMPWQEVTLTIGEALGRSELAEELVAEVEALFAAARQEHPEFAGVTLAAVTGAFEEGQYGFFASADPRARIFSSLGFELPAEFDEIAGEQFYGNISAEQLELFDRDLVVFQQIQFVEDGLAGLKADRFVQQLDAVREGRVAYVDQELDDALAFNSVLSLPFALDGLLPQLAAALDGDPAAAAA